MLINHGDRKLTNDHLMINVKEAFTWLSIVYWLIYTVRVFNSNFGMGEPEARWGGDLCVIRDMFEITFNFRKYMTLKQFFHHYTYE